MARTGRLGSSESRLGNIILGRAGAAAVVNANAAPPTVAAVAAVPTPTVIGTASGVAIAPTVAAVASVSAPTVKAAAIAAPAKVTAVAAVPAPSVIVVLPAIGVQFPDLQLVIGQGANKRILNGVGKNEVMQHAKWGSIMPGGHHTLECNLRDSERTANPLTYRYGAGLTLRQAPVIPGGLAESGQILWQGYMVTPVANDDGTFDILGKGWHHIFLERDDALLWQDRFYGDWQNADSDGLSLGQTDGAIDSAVNNGSLAWKVAKGQDIQNGDHARLVWYYANTTILVRRVAGTIFKNRQLAANPEYDLKLERATGPNVGGAGWGIVNGSLPGLGNNNLGDNGTVFNEVLVTPQPVVGLGLFCTASGSGSTGFAFKATVRNLRVNDLAPGDTYTSSQVVADLANKLGFTVGSKVSTTTQNILPLFWQEGPWWDLMDYLALAENAKWAIWENNPNPEIEFRTWDTPGRSWTANAYGSTATTIAHLAPDDEVWSVVDVAYRKGNSARVRHVRKDVSPDPFQGLTPQRVRTYRIELQDSQPDDVLAQSVADALALEFGTEQLSGTVTGSFLTEGGTDKSMYEARAGDVLTIPDYPGGSRTVRVYGVDHDSEGLTTLTIGRVPSRLDRILWNAERRKRRKGTISA